jgi:hypothetical protein
VLAKHVAELRCEGGRVVAGRPLVGSEASVVAGEDDRFDPEQPCDRLTMVGPFAR